MTTFEELEVGPELVEALAAEGVESPTALQRDLLPVVRRGNNVVAVAGPGAGILIGYAVPLLQRVEAEGDQTKILILTPTQDRALGLAEGLAPLAAATGHRVSALAPLWVMPERSQVLLGTPESIYAAVKGGRLSLEGVEAVVVDGAGSMGAAGTLETAGSILEGVSAGAQRVVVALPVTEEVQRFVEAHAKRAVHVPPMAQGGPRESSPSRGSLTVQEVSADRTAATVAAVARLLTEARHVVTFVRTEDAAADLADDLLLRGYVSGRVGDPQVPVWLAVDALETRKQLDEEEGEDIAILSVDVPADVDMLDQRHGGGRGGTVVALSRELPHVKAAAREAGYEVEILAEAGPPPRPERMGALMDQLSAAMDGHDVEAYQLLLEPLFEKHGTAAVAAAAVALLRDRRPATATAAPSAIPEGVQGYVRLFVSVGKKDGANPGDLVGAITGEAKVDAAKVGRIDLRETFSLVEVEKDIADKVIAALNGVTIRGRAARVDYHREDRRGPGGDRGGRPGDRGGRPGDRGGRPSSRGGPGGRGPGGPRGHGGPGGGRGPRPGGQGRGGDRGGRRDPS